MLSAAVLALVLTALLIWWPLEQGAYFPVVYLPGAILLYVTLITLLIVAPLPISFRGPHAVALAALLAFTGWTALSLLWSPAQDLALEDAQRTLIYPAAFLAGLWMAALLRQRLALVLVPWAVAATTVAVVTIVQILGSDAARNLLDPDLTLDFPLAYRNANAAFFVISALVLIAIAARHRSPVPLQVGCIGVAVGCICLAMISQSRGSVLAAAVGTLVLLLASQERLRVAITLLIVAVPTAIVAPELLDPFTADSRKVAFDELQNAARIVPLAALGGALAALPVGLLLGRSGASGTATRRGGGRRGLLAVGGAVLTLTVAAVLVVAGNPFDSISLDDAGGRDNRFTYTGGLSRTDFWEVSLEQLSDAPVVGEGSGSFRTRYALDREAQYLPRDAHSIEFETIGELGAIGVLLLVLSGGSIVVAVLRSRRLGADQGTLVAAALAVGAAWTTQASVDWFTSFPALTAPTLALLGAAAAPAAAPRPGRRPARAVRGALIGGLAIFAIAAIPQFASDRLSFDAAANWEADPQAAYDALDRAADLNPFADAPLLVTAEIAKATDDTERGLSALERARERQPREWLNYFLEAELLADDDPSGARVALERAKELNPLAKEISRLERRLRRGTAEGASAHGVSPQP